MTKSANWRGPETKHKRSKIAFAVTSIALSLMLYGIKVLELPVQSLKQTGDVLVTAGLHIRDRTAGSTHLVLQRLPS